MAVKSPLCNYAGTVKELQAGDSLPAGTPISSVLGASYYDLSYSGYNTLDNGRYYFVTTGANIVNYPDLVPLYSANTYLFVFNIDNTTNTQYQSILTITSGDSGAEATTTWIQQGTSKSDADSRGWVQYNVVPQFVKLVMCEDDLPAPTTAPFGSYTSTVHVLNGEFEYVVGAYISLTRPLYCAGAVVHSADSNQWWLGFEWTLNTDACLVNAGVDGYFDADFHHLWLQSNGTAPLFAMINSTTTFEGCYLVMNNASQTTFGTLSATAGDSTTFFVGNCQFTSLVQTGLPITCASTSTFKNRVVVREHDARIFMPYYCNTTTSLGTTTTINGVVINRTYNQVSPRFDFTGCQTNSVILRLESCQFFMRANIGGTVYDSGKYIAFTNNAFGKFFSLHVVGCTMVSSQSNAQLNSTQTGLSQTNFCDTTNYQRQGNANISACFNIPNTRIMGVVTGTNTSTASATSTYKVFAVSGGSNNALKAESNTMFDAGGQTALPAIRYLGTLPMDYQVDCHFVFNNTFNSNTLFDFAMFQQASSGVANNSGTNIGTISDSSSSNGNIVGITFFGIGQFTAVNDTVTLQWKQNTGALRTAGIASYTIVIHEAGS